MATLSCPSGEDIVISAILIINVSSLLPVLVFRESLCGCTTGYACGDLFATPRGPHCPIVPQVAWAVSVLL